MPRHRAPSDALATDLAGIALASPVLLAAGTAGTLDEMAGVVDLSRVGGLVTKSITRLPREGNATWRLWPVEGGMLNAIGLANPGIERFAADIAPRAERLPCPVIGSAAGFTIEDYIAVAAAMDDLPGLRAVELNVSCPNVHGGVEFGADPGALRELLSAVRPVLTRAKMFVKLSPVAVGTPNTLADLARVAIDARADALCLCNTTPAMAIDPETRRPVLANVTGGLSGPAIRPIVVRLVHLVYRGVARDARVPIVGIGGILRWQHAAELMLAGASAVQVGAGLFADPRCPVTIARGLEKWAHRQGVERVADLVGQVDLPA
jgi:dihydroorotate dehydrogenase (NAD+) catalytic subunit